MILQKIFLVIALAIRVVAGVDHKKLFSSEIEIQVSEGGEVILRQCFLYRDVKKSNSYFAYFVHFNNKKSPEWMQGYLDHRGALFGPFPTGESIQAQLFYTTRKLCGDETPNTPESVKKNEYFLLVDRGGCSFVEKVRNAQRDNATAVFIADDKCTCNSDNICEDDPGEVCDNSIPVMDNDGSGEDIMIPSMMLYKPDAEVLKAELVKGTDIEVNLSFPVPKAVNGRTKYILWTSSDDIESHQFVSTFLEAAVQLKDRAVFTPKMFIKDGTEKGCRAYDLDDEPCPGVCTNYGRYCPSRLYDSDIYDNHGTKMVVESLRRMCIWEVYGKKDGVGSEWWQYTKEWIQKCSNSHYSAKCAADVYETVGIDESLIESCMKDSGDFGQDVENVLLDTSILEAEDYAVTFAPALYVNDVVVRGTLSFGTVLNAICKTFENDTPEICNRWEACSKDCGAGETCILQGTDCVSYDLPESGGDEYDDDYITGGGDDDVDDEVDDGVDDDGQDDDVDDDDDDDNDDNSQITSSPTNSPTQGVKKAPTSVPIVKTTDAPTTLSPSRSPTKQPARGPSPQFTIQPPTLHDEETISETVQIFEGNNDKGPNSDFIVGLAAGLVGALLSILLFAVYVKDRQRQVLLSRIAMEDRRGLLLAEEFDDEETQGSRYSGRSRRSRSRHWKDARYDDDDLDEYVDFTAQHSRRYRTRNLRKEGSKSNQRQTSRSRRYYDDYLSDEETIDPVLEAENVNFQDEYDDDITERRRQSILRKSRMAMKLEDEYGNPERRRIPIRRERSINFTIDDDLDGVA